MASSSPSSACHSVLTVPENFGGDHTAEADDDETAALSPRRRLEDAMVDDVDDGTGSTRHKKDTKKKDWRSAAASYWACRHHHGRNIPTWIVFGFLMLLTASIVFYLRAMRLEAAATSVTTTTTHSNSTTSGSSIATSKANLDSSISSNSSAEISTETHTTNLRDPNHNVVSTSTNSTTHATKEATIPNRNSNNNNNLPDTRNKNDGIAQVTNDKDFVQKTHRDMLLSILTALTPRRILLNTTTPQGQAFRWLLQSVNRRRLQQQNDSLKQQLLERYAIVTLDFALASNATPTTPALADVNLPTCQWTGVSCGNGTNTTDDSSNVVSAVDDKDENVFVTGLTWPGLTLSGQIPNEIKGLRYVQHLDLAENDLTGTLPSGIFSLTNLKELYLHQNRLSGTLHVQNDEIDMNAAASANTRTPTARLAGFAQLHQLEMVYLGNNFFHGPFPTGLTNHKIRGGKIRQLRYLSLHQNLLTGPLPDRLNWRHMVYLDLSNNRLNGTLPAEWCQEKNVTDTTTDGVTVTRTKMTTTLPRIRYLFLNHNQFTGTIPQDFPRIAGNGRMELLHVGDNRLHGTIPGNYSKSRIFMTSLEVQHNQFTSMDPYICTLSVLTPPDGELVNLRADCPVCMCPSLCRTPCPNNTFPSSSHHHHHHHHHTTNTTGNHNSTAASVITNTSSTPPVATTAVGAGGR